FDNAMGYPFQWYLLQDLDQIPVPQGCLSHNSFSLSIDHCTPNVARHNHHNDQSEGKEERFVQDGVQSPFVKWLFFYVFQVYLLSLLLFPLVMFEESLTVIFSNFLVHFHAIRQLVQIPF